MSAIVKPLPVIQDTPLTKTDQHLQGQHIYNSNISPSQYHELASEKDMSTSGPSTKSNVLSRFLAKSKYRLWIFIASIILVLLAIILGVLGGLGKLSPHSSSDLAVSGPSIGATKYPGTSNGTATPGHFDMYGSGDGTYYDPSVGITACGTSNLATDMVCALNYIDYGTYANPNDSPVCGACIEVTGPLGTVQVTIQDKCPGCGQGSLDLTPSAFNKIGDPTQGRIPVSWKPC
ncbi:hypothetical protein K450DRAFT_231820 [Umbelopsis ramanniana AG]|uniref:RlpA-like protein double-psi beta-barrel domain-containing protein n=1 Tax=Umbelopsis ramanniana AG TaxID=1314678 RepID=A0AAD5EDM0_UMBRA|nr:uncharacterized protein K450DRAFT_231820 [Umbelopsis ramanniana AG]KAI8581544.1 hypothetical protein K450DRAFT_231820 [Umbelopsis ramanniana AG]